MTALAVPSVEELHGRCVFCGAPLCFGPYECCAMFGQRTHGALVVAGDRAVRQQNGQEVCKHPQCALLAQMSERLTLDRLVKQVAEQIVSGPTWPARDDRTGWALERARNIIAALQPDLRITPIAPAGKPLGHGWSCRCQGCDPGIARPL